MKSEIFLFLMSTKREVVDKFLYIVVWNSRDNIFLSIPLNSLTVWGSLLSNPPLKGIWLASLNKIPYDFLPLIE